MSSEANEALFPMVWCHAALPFHTYIPDPFPSPTFSLHSYLQFLSTLILPPSDHPHAVPYSVIPPPWYNPWFLQTVMVTSSPVPFCSLTSLVPSTSWDLSASQLHPFGEGSSQALLALPGLEALPRCLHSTAIPFYRMCKTLILPSPTCS